MIFPDVFFIFFFSVFLVFLIFSFFELLGGGKRAKNGPRWQKICLLQLISQETYDRHLWHTIIWSSFMGHLCKMMISPGVFFIFSKFWFFGLLKGGWGVGRGVKGQKMVQNDKKFCLMCSISQESYIISYLFMVLMCKMIISLGVFFIFSKFWFSELLGGKGQKLAHNDKKLCLLRLIFQEPYIIWLSFVVHQCKVIISPGIKKGQKMLQNDKKKNGLTLYVRNCTSYDCGFWYTCVKQFFFIFSKFWFFGLFKVRTFLGHSEVCPTFFTCVWFFLNVCKKWDHLPVKLFESTVLIPKERNSLFTFLFFGKPEFISVKNRVFIQQEFTFCLPNIWTYHLNIWILFLFVFCILGKIYFACFCINYYYIYFKRQSEYQS